MKDLPKFDRRKWSKEDAAYKNMGVYTAKGHREEQARALVMRPTMTTYEKLTDELNQIISKYVF